MIEYNRLPINFGDFTVMSIYRFLNLHATTNHINVSQIMTLSPPAPSLYLLS